MARPGETWVRLVALDCRRKLTKMLGHCYLMTENLQKAYDAYQQALVNLRDPKVRSFPISTHPTVLESIV